MSGLMSGSALERLVELSVCKKARLDSDSTLVAVITAVSDANKDYFHCIQLQYINIVFTFNSHNLSTFRSARFLSLRTSPPFSTNLEHQS